MIRRVALVLAFALTALAQEDPALRAFGAAPSLVDAGLTYPLLVSYANIGETPATNVTITIDVPNPNAFANVPSFCTVSGTRATCTIASLAPRTPLAGFATFELSVLAPNVSDADLAIHIEIAAANRSGVFTNEVATHVFRTFYVENTNDSGAGSLRDAIIIANDDCDPAAPCKIAFRIRGASLHTITPSNELPALRANNIWLDATTQARYIGDANASGPEIELNGALQAGGNGIAVAESCSFHILGFVLNGFASNGVSVTSGCNETGERIIANNFIGTDATGTMAVPNNRGVALDTSAQGVVIENNLISGNLRSGVFIVNGNGAVVRRNTIGLNVTLDHALGNGASGVYIAPGGANTDVNDNYIGFNAHFGVAIDTGAIRVALHGNSFQANGQLAIDYGLDGPTESVPEVIEGPGAMLASPRITSAHYDAIANETIIEGIAPTSGDRQNVIVSVYASDANDPSGYGEGQHLVGTRTLVQPTRMRTAVFDSRSPATHRGRGSRRRPRGARSSASPAARASPASPAPASSPRPQSSAERYKSSDGASATIAARP